MAPCFWPTWHVAYSFSKTKDDVPVCLSSYGREKVRRRKSASDAQAEQIKLNVRAM